MYLLHMYIASHIIETGIAYPSHIPIVSYPINGIEAIHAAK